MKAIICDKCKKAITGEDSEKIYAFRLFERRLEDGQIMNGSGIIDLCEECKNDVYELIDRNLVCVNMVLAKG